MDILQIMESESSIFLEVVVVIGEIV